MIISYSFDEAAERIKIFKDDGIPSFNPSTSPLHKHEHAEVHLIIKGDMRFTVEGSTYKLCAGDAILIPSGFFHMTESEDNERVHFSFQTKMSQREIVIKQFPKDFLSELQRKLKNGEDCINHLFFICAELGNINHYKSDSQTDYKHIIGHFFDKRHQENVQIKDLSETLHLSKMHTQRLIKKHTGMTFGENLRSYRMRVADYLTQNTDMTEEEIARYVGYRSYSGYWKAKKKK